LKWQIITVTAQTVYNLLQGRMYWFTSFMEAVAIARQNMS